MALMMGLIQVCSTQPDLSLHALGQMMAPILVCMRSARPDHPRLDSEPARPDLSLPVPQ